MSGTDTKTVPAEVAAALIMVSPRRLRQLVAEGFVPRPKTHGAYSLLGVVQGYLRSLLADGRPGARPSSSSSALSDARTAEILQRIATRDAALLKDAVEGSQAVLDAAAGGLRSDILSIPARVTRDRVLRATIEREFEAAFKRAALRAEAAAQDPEPTTCPT